MSTLTEIKAAAAALSKEEKAELLRSLAAELEAAPENGWDLGRQPDLHAGIWEVSDDFDAPLKDEFWMGGE
jgi:benzoyl-CoA reductase/2-hydroxyglutaryl-CoA dehydratase subunit BcrC/BadD/HgdB